MRSNQITYVLLLVAASNVHCELVSERWGEVGCTYPGTLKTIATGNIKCLRFDLSALPANATIYHASFSYDSAGRIQPVDPVQVFVAEQRDSKSSPVGDALPLEAPWFLSLDATEAVRQWVKNPEKNCGFYIKSFDGLNTKEAFLEIRYEGTAKKVPKQITGLSAIHCNGQTFLTWKEIPEFQPAADKIIWVNRFMGDHPHTTGKEPGKDAHGNQYIPAVTCRTLREIQGVEVREKGLGAVQQLPPQKRIREIPRVCYRVYRSTRKIAAENLSQTEVCGVSPAMNEYMDLTKYWIVSDGEYYNQRENPDAAIPTLCVANSKPVLPGQSYYVHTPQQAGSYYYAVTTVENGTENASTLNEANSLETPVEEKVETPQPVFQMAGRNHWNSSIIEQWYCFWPVPPLTNFPCLRPERIGVGVPEKVSGPLPITIATGHSYDWMFTLPAAPGASVVSNNMLSLGIGGGGDLCYNEGAHTLRCFKQSKLDYFYERYNLAVINWAFRKWEVDRSHVYSNLSTHFMIRHPDITRVMFTHPFESDFDQKWNPASGTLATRLGPREMTLQPDGSCAWDMFDIPYFLKKNPAREVPYVAVIFAQPKDGNHGAEYGWQDDPRGMAGLRDSRQPFCAQWGGASFSTELKKLLNTIRWDKSVPAFSNCTLDNNPGNGDPDDGDPWGQLNGYLVWQYDDIVDSADQWQMTVSLTNDAPRDICKVDLTPRQCLLFKSSAGQKYTWTNMDLKENKQIAGGEVVSDQWGLVTLPQVTVTRGKNRIIIKAP